MSDLPPARQSLRPARLAGAALLALVVGMPDVGHAAGAGGIGWVDCLTSASAEFELTFNAAGLLRDLRVAEGEIVRAGMLLAKTDDALAAARVAILARRVGSGEQIEAQRLRVDLARNRLERVRRLRRQNVASSTELEEAEHQYRLAELALDEAKVQASVLEEELTFATIQLEQTRLVAPADGVVVALHRRPGEFVSGDQPVLTLATLDPLTVRAYLPVEDHPLVASAVTVTVEPAPPFDSTVSGHIASIDRRFDAASRSFGVRIEVENPDYAIPADHRCRVRFDR